ncbi:hypothetical protein SDC9_125033 [bioreactor metagenome]|uniref:Uncharacterized protein n=1 Tax=bioreactor metagenome TaxID=1076179 RepID=A0A645CM49_9ZZZZ
MQIITFQSGFYFFGKVKELQDFLKENTCNNITVRDFIKLRLQ